MKNFARVGFVVLAIICAAVWPAGCTVTVTDAGADGGGGDANDSTGDSSGATGSQLISDTVNDPALQTAVSFPGDGLAAKRAALPDLYPEVNDLIAGGTDTAEAMLAEFDRTPLYRDDDHLFVFAYALEQMNYTAGVDRLVTFLEEHTTGQATNALSAVTHAVRRMTGQPLDLDAAYLISEIEESIALAGGPSSKRRPIAKRPRTSCWKELIITDENGNELRYPDDHPDPNKAGRPIKVGGNVQSQNSVSEERAREVFQEVIDGGGVYVEGGTTFQNQPTNQLNCAGYVFRDANPDGGQWTAQPGRWFEALRAAGAIEQRTLPSRLTVEPGDIVFYYRRGQSSPAHVAEVQSVSTFDGITVRNADGETGLFDADIDADYFFGEQGGNIGARYERSEVWTLTNGELPPMVSNTDRRQDNSCHGEDTDGDGFPDTDVCTIEPRALRCIDPDFDSGDGAPQSVACCVAGECQEIDSETCQTLGGSELAAGETCATATCSGPFLVMVISNFQNKGHYAIVDQHDIDDPPGLLSLSCAGLSNDPAIWAPESGTLFDTAEEAAASLCPRITSFFTPVLAPNCDRMLIDGDVWPDDQAGYDPIIREVCSEVPGA